MDCRRNFLAERRQQLFDVVHHFDGIGAGLALDGENDGALVVVPGGHLVVIYAVDDVAEFFQADRGAVAPGDDDGAVGGGVGERAARLDSERLFIAIQAAGGQIGVTGRDGALYFVDPNAADGELVGVHLHAHGVLLHAEHLHARDAAHHGDALRQQGVGVLVDGVHGQRGGIEREVENGLLGGVDLAVRRRARHAGRQVSAGAGDGGLYILRGGVDLAVQGELHGDRRTAEGVGGVHRLYAGDGGELALQRRGHGGRHGFGTGAGQRGRHLNGGVIHARQRRHRQLSESDGAEEQNGEADERGHDGPLDEEAREVHDFPASSFAGSTSCTCAPGKRRNWPSVTTVSPGAMPFSITIFLPKARPAVTARTATLLSCPTT